MRSSDSWIESYVSELNFSESPTFFPKIWHTTLSFTLKILFSQGIVRFFFNILNGVEHNSHDFHQFQVLIVTVSMSFYLSITFFIYISFTPKETKKKNLTIIRENNLRPINKQQNLKLRMPPSCSIRADRPDRIYILSSVRERIELDRVYVCLLFILLIQFISYS